MLWTVVEYDQQVISFLELLRGNVHGWCDDLVAQRVGLGL